MTRTTGDPFEPSPERLAAARRQRRAGRRLGWLLGDKIFPRVRADNSLRFLHEVIGLDHLTYGLWEGEGLDRDGLKTAQRRYAERLVSWIPAGVERALDVGCGTGELALRLHARGIAVEGLSPDPALGRIFQRRTGLPFHLVRFELFSGTQPFDLIVMSESAQYVLLDQLFRSVVRLSPRAYLLVADYFRVTADASRSGHLLPDFLDEAERWGFTLLRREDVSEQVAPTLELARRWHERYVHPSFGLLQEAAAARFPLLWRLARPLLARPIARLERLADDFDVATFLRTKRYLFFLFQAPPSLAAISSRHRDAPAR